jgi:hypothetical protein
LSGILGHASTAAYSLAKEHPPQVTGALRARVTNGATFFDESAFAIAPTSKKILWKSRI